LRATPTDSLDKYTQSNPPTAGETRTKQDLGNALAKALGPVGHFFGQSSCINRIANTLYSCLPLKPHVLALSPKTLEAVLASAALQVATENEVYPLLVCWLYPTPHVGAFDGIHQVPIANCLPLFRHLVKFVRHHHLSPVFDRFRPPLLHPVLGPI